MKAPQKKKADPKNLVTALRICLAFPSAGLEERQTSVILTKAGVPNIRHKGYEFLPAVGALIAHYKTGYESRDVAGESDRARKNKAEADAAERRNMREAGELIPTAVAVALVEPIMVVIRQKICASSLTDPEKDDMLADIERAKEMDWGKAAREAMR